MFSIFYSSLFFCHRDPYKVRNMVAFCKLCKTETFGLLELRGHLYSEQHIEKEKLLQR